MHEGYIYSRRKTLDNPISTNLELLGFWNYCLLRANHKRNSFFVGLVKVTIEPGQFVSSVTKLAKKFSIAKSRMYRIVKLLEEEGMLKHEGNTRYSLFTIVNRSRYQKVKHEGNTSETQLVTNNNDNNEKEGKEVYSFGEFWDDYSKKVGDKKKAKKKFDKLSDKQKLKIKNTLPSFLASIANKQYQPYPLTYLNGERWNDVLDDKKRGFDYWYDEYIKAVQSKTNDGLDIYKAKLKKEYGETRKEDMYRDVKKKFKESDLFIPRS